MADKQTSISVKLIADLRNFIAGMKKGKSANKSFGDSVNKNIVPPLTKLNSKLRQLKSAQRKAASTAEWKAYQKRIDLVNKKIDKFKGKVTGIRAVAKKAFSGIAGYFVGAFALGSVISGISTLISKIVKFEKANTTLAATLQTNVFRIRDLTKQAQKLGKDTQYTATQVLELQNELAKLGFNKTEIKNSTKDILDLAEATDSELAPAAKIAGSALRAFDLDSSEMSRVTSVLAVATTKSALSMEDYATSLSTLAPVAKAFGFTIEDTVALFGKLKDAGFDASSSATATRNIILNLADSNGALAKSLGGSVKNFDQLIDGLVTLRKKGVDLNTTLELTDKRSVAAFNQFLTGAESVKTLRNNLIDVNDELSQMVATKTDNVEGALKRVGSAFEFIVLKMKNSAGAMKVFLDAIASGLIALGTSYEDVIEDVKDNTITQYLKGDIKELNDLSSKFRETGLTAQDAQLKAAKAIKKSIEDWAVQIGWLSVDQEDQYKARIDQLDRIIKKNETATGSTGKQIKELTNEGNTIADVEAKIKSLQGEQKTASGLALANINAEIKKYTELKTALENIQPRDTTQTNTIKTKQATQVTLSTTGTGSADITKQLAGGISDLQSQLTRLQALQSTALSPEEWQDYQKQIEATQNKIDDFTGKVKQSQSTTEVISEMSDQFGILSNSIGGTVGSFLSLFSTLLGLIPQMITQISALTTAQVTSSETTAAAAGTEAIAKGTAASQSMPFPLNLIALASTIAAIVSALSTKPKALASGGVAYGDTIAQVGEYANARNNPEVIAPLSRLKGMMQQGTGQTQTETFIPDLKIKHDAIVVSYERGLARRKKRTGK